MPLPKTTDVSKLIRFLHRENQKRPPGKKWSRKQIIAIALRQARKSGAKIPRK